MHCLAQSQCSVNRKTTFMPEKEDGDQSGHVLYVIYDTYICHRVLIGLKFAAQVKNISGWMEYFFYDYYYSHPASFEKWFEASCCKRHLGYKTVKVRTGKQVLVGELWLIERWASPPRKSLSSVLAPDMRCPPLFQMLSEQIIFHRYSEWRCTCSDYFPPTACSFLVEKSS